MTSETTTEFKMEFVVSTLQWWNMSLTQEKSVIMVIAERNTSLVCNIPGKWFCQVLLRCSLEEGSVLIATVQAYKNTNQKLSRWHKLVHTVIKPKSSKNTCKTSGKEMPDVFLQKVMSFSLIITSLKVNSNLVESSLYFIDEFSCVWKPCKKHSW